MSHGECVGLEQEVQFVGWSDVDFNAMNFIGSRET